MAEAIALGLMTAKGEATDYCQCAYDDIAILLRSSKIAPPQGHFRWTRVSVRAVVGEDPSGGPLLTIPPGRTSNSPSTVTHAWPKPRPSAVSPPSRNPVLTAWSSPTDTPAG